MKTEKNVKANNDQEKVVCMDEDKLIVDEVYDKQIINVYIGYAWQSKVSARSDLFWKDLRELFVKKSGVPKKYDKHVTVRVNRLRSSHGFFVYENIKKRIQDADILIFDIANIKDIINEDARLLIQLNKDKCLNYTSFNNNALLELGIALAFDKTVIVMCPECLAKAVPSDLNGILWTYYNTTVVADSSGKVVKISRKLVDDVGLTNYYRGQLVSRAKHLSEDLYL